MADKDIQIDQKKRARRRLVGAVVLASVAAVALPLVMDQEPRPVGQAVQIRTANAPAVNEPPIQPAQPAQVQPAAPLPQASPVATAPKTAGPADEVAKPVDKPVDKGVDKPEKDVDKGKETPQGEVKKGETKAAEVPKPSETARKPDAVAESARAEAILNGAEPPKPAPPSRYLVQVGVYANPATVKHLRERLKAEGFSPQVEALHTEKGSKSRLKVGPYASKEAAQKARDRLKRIGLDGAVIPKP